MTGFATSIAPSSRSRKCGTVCRHADIRNPFSLAGDTFRRQKSTFASKLRSSAWFELVETWSNPAFSSTLYASVLRW